jgi:hypothetical protein
MRLVMLSILVLAAVLIVSTGHSPMAAEDAGKDSGLAQAKLKYAQALVKLQEADLRKAQEANNQAPAAVPATVVQMLQSDVAMAKARARALEDGAAKSQESSYVSVARDALTAAEQALKQATEVNARVSGTFNAAEVARRQAQVELARARLDVAQQLDKATPEERMQWEILVLQQDVHELRFAVELLQHHN